MHRMHMQGYNGSNMGKILLLAIAVWLIFKVLKQYTQSVNKTEEPQSASEDMVKCAHCGIHLPKSDSLLIKGEFFCCEAHSKKRT